MQEKEKWFSLTFLVAAVALVYLATQFYRFGLIPSSLPSPKPVLTICHDIEDNRYVKALSLLCEDFEDLRQRQGHPVKVRLLSIAPEVYAAWIDNRMEAGRGPDLCRIPASMATAEIERRFTPLDKVAATPNPYNDYAMLDKLARWLSLHQEEWIATGDGEQPVSVINAIERLSPVLRTNSVSAPLRDLLVDRMDGGYHPGAQHIYSFALDASQQRICYNRDILAQIMGNETPPNDLKSFFHICQQATVTTNQTGEYLTAIAADRDTPARLFNGTYQDTFTWAAARGMDFNLNGHVDLREWATAWRDGNWIADDPALKAYAMLGMRMKLFLTPDNSRRNSDQDIADLLHERAVMAVVGVEDSNALLMQTNIPVGFIRFPPAGREGDQLAFGRLPVRETTRANVRFGLNRNSRQHALARDFIRFALSCVWNETFARISGRVPVVRGVHVPQNAKAFQPESFGLANAGLPIMETPALRNAFHDLVKGQTDYDDLVLTIEAVLENAYESGDPENSAAPYADAQEIPPMPLLRIEEGKMKLLTR